MNKIKMLAGFIKKSDTPFNTFSEILGSYLHIPIILIHEGLHLLFIFLLRSEWKFDKENSYFLKKTTSKTTGDEVIKKYSFPIYLNENAHLKNVIIAAAPTLGYPIWLFIIHCISLQIILFPSIILIYFWMLLIIYFIVNFQLIGMSDTDIHCFLYHSRILISKLKKHFFIKKIIRILALWTGI